VGRGRGANGGIGGRICHIGLCVSALVYTGKCVRERTYGPACSIASHVTRNRTIIELVGGGRERSDALNVSPHRRRRARCSWASSSGNGRPTKVNTSGGGE
jgi:hypothetical protein